MSVQMLLTVLEGLVRFLVQVVPLTFVALFGVELLVQLGVMRRLEPLGRPLTRLSRLPAVSTLTFMASIGSVVAANSMLAGYRNDGLIDDREVVLTSLLNTVPMYLRELLTYHFPVIFPLLGFRVGMVYFMTFWLSGLIKICFIILGGRMLLGGERKGPESTAPLRTAGTLREEGWKPEDWKQLARSIFQCRMHLFLRISGTYAAVTFVLLLFTELGYFKWVDALLAPLTERFGLPAQVIGPLSAYVVSPMVGLASVSTLLGSGQLSEYQAIVALLLGGFLMIPLIYLRSMLPTYVALFGAKLGGLIVSLSVAFSLLARTVMLAAVLGGFLQH